MDNTFALTENDFFTWLSNASSYDVKEIKGSYRAINSMLMQRKALAKSIVETTQIDQIEYAQNR